MLYGRVRCQAKKRRKHFWGLAQRKGGIVFLGVKSLDSIQMSMRKLNSQLFCKTTHSGVVAMYVMYKLLYPSIRVRTALLYRSGSGLGLVLVLRCNAIAHTVLRVSHQCQTIEGRKTQSEAHYVRHELIMHAPLFILQTYSTVIMASRRPRIS